MMPFEEGMSYYTKILYGQWKWPLNAHFDVFTLPSPHPSTILKQIKNPWKLLHFASKQYADKVQRSLNEPTYANERLKMANY